MSINVTVDWASITIFCKIIFEAVPKNLMEK